MNPTLRRLVILHRAALGRWKVYALRRAALITSPGPLDRAAYYGACWRMAVLDAAMDRLERAMAAL